MSNPFDNRIHNIFLIRHAESKGNVDKSIHTTMPDHAIPLSNRGEIQAALAGEKLAAWLELNLRGSSKTDMARRRRSAVLGEKTTPPLDYTPEELQLRLWTSPYKRTRQTADAIASKLNEGGQLGWLRDRAENILLCEQQFGLFDGISDAELPLKFPNEYAHYKKCEDFEGRFWARMPMGESRFDVCQRVHQAFGTFQRDAERHNVQNIAIVCHGVTMRAFKMMWLHKTPEWFEEEKNPGNCAIHHISLNLLGRYVDEGCIFEGFKA